ncbi:uncharacterized protein LOC114665880 isoform X2 [Erpetoichthys calabaricus]|uniref:uncharacterized protein LOC114665880 isoform X2 n=1 Tax=Erpetoichthys calabaricus TaxID=27687 RepID=UPI0010A00295|nr:uncharacterized protein LOC114665880 isoform X2 [Erpetoichthys calabaricus]
MKTMTISPVEGMKEEYIEPEFPLLSSEEEIHILHARVQQLEKEKADLEKENRHLKDMLVSEIPSLLSTMRQTISGEEKETPPLDVFSNDEDDSFSSAYTTPSLQAQSPVQASEEANLYNPAHATNYVEVYKGSNVFCDGMVWKAATQANSPTAMARTFLLGVFDMATLLRSNLRGGKSKRANYADQKEGLDPAKLDAIYNATLEKFPNAKRGQIGVGINSKLSEIRFRYRRNKQDKGCDIFC